MYQLARTHNSAAANVYLCKLNCFIVRKCTILDPKNSKQRLHIVSTIALADVTYELSIFAGFRPPNCAYKE